MIMLLFACKDSCSTKSPHSQPVGVDTDNETTLAADWRQTSSKQCRHVRVFKIMLTWKRSSSPRRRARTGNLRVLAQLKVKLVLPTGRYFASDHCVFSLEHQVSSAVYFVQT